MFSWLRRLFKPRHSLESVIKTLLDGLEDSSITVRDEGALFQAIVAFNETGDLPNTLEGCETIVSTAAGVLAEFQKRQAAGIFGVTDSEWLALTDPRVRQMVLSGGCAEAYRVGLRRLETYKLMHDGFSARPKNGVMH